jgi:hypothetical protein
VAAWLTARRPAGKDLVITHTVTGQQVSGPSGTISTSYVYGAAPRRAPL